MNYFLSGLSLALLLQTNVAAQSNPLYWEPFWNLALDHRPELAAASNKLESASLEQRLAGRWENPEIEYEIEGIDGDDEERSLRLRQTLPLSGRKAAARRVADARREIAAAETLETRLTMAGELSNLALDLWRWRKVAVLRREALDHAELFSRTADARVQGGQASGVERTKALLEKNRAELALKQANRQRAVALRRLALACGVNEDTLPPRVLLEKVHPDLPVRDVWASLRNQGPDREKVLIGFELERAEARAVAGSWRPDVSLTGGVLEGAENEQTYLAAVSLQLPLWNAGRSLRKKLNHDLEAVELKIAAYRSQLEREDALAWMQLQNLKEELEEEAGVQLPLYLSLLQQAHSAYAEGASDYLELLDAMSGLRDQQELCIDLRVDLERALFELNFLQLELNQ